MARYILLFTFLVLSSFLFSNVNKAYAINAMSKTYHTAFVYPRTFDNNINEHIQDYPDYFDKFETCAELAPNTLDNLEQYLREKYSVCPNNPTCTKLANDINVVVHLKIKIEKLIRFIRAKKYNPQLRLSDSDIGREAIRTNNIFRQNNIDITTSPVFLMEREALDNIPCQ